MCGMVLGSSLIFLINVNFKHLKFFIFKKPTRSKYLIFQSLYKTKHSALVVLESGSICQFSYGEKWLCK